MPGQKAASLLAANTGLLDPYAALEAALRSHLIGALGGDPDTDIDEIEVLRDADGCLYTGKWKGHSRLIIGMVVHPTLVAEVLLVATRGPLVADMALFGQVVPNIGNAALVARLMHISMFALRCSGVIAIANTPVTVRLRRHYEDMGFEQNGTRLPLSDANALTRAFSYIDGAYQHPRVQGLLSLAMPPLPL